MSNAPQYDSPEVDYSWLGLVNFSPDSQKSAEEPLPWQRDTSIMRSLNHELAEEVEGSHNGTKELPDHQDGNVFETRKRSSPPDLPVSNSLRSTSTRSIFDNRMDPSLLLLFPEAHQRALADEPQVNDVMCPIDNHTNNINNVGNTFYYRLLLHYRDSYFKSPTAFGKVRGLKVYLQYAFVLNTICPPVIRHAGESRCKAHPLLTRGLMMYSFV